MSRLRTLSLHSLLAAAAVACTLGAFEIGTRLFARVGPTLLVKDPTIGKRFIPGYAGRVYVPEAGREVFLRFNREGFRGPDIAETPASGTRRVAIIGDSMTVAVAVDEERTYVRLLANALNENSGSTRWEVLNFGVSSASTGQELVYYREVAARYHPDVVVCAFYTGNDLADNSIRMTRAARLYFDFDRNGELALTSLGPRASPVADWLDQHSRFYVWQKVAFASLRSRFRAARQTLDVGHRVFETRDDENLSHAWRITERLLVAFRDDVEKRGGRFIVAVLPCAQQIHADLWDEMVARAGGVSLDRDNPERRLLGIAARHGIEMVALTAAFRQAADRSAAELFLGHRFHFSETGHALAAEILMPVIRDEPSVARPADHRR